LVVGSGTPILWGGTEKLENRYVVIPLRFRGAGIAASALTEVFVCWLAFAIASREEKIIEQPIG
jgi:hypothetical protein